MDCKAQTSFEYLLTMSFSTILVIAAFVIALQLKFLADAAKSDILKYRESTIQSLLK